MGTICVMDIFYHCIFSIIVFCFTGLPKDINPRKDGRVPSTNVPKSMGTRDFKRFILSCWPRVREFQYCYKSSLDGNPNRLKVVEEDLCPATLRNQIKASVLYIRPTSVRSLVRTILFICLNQMHVMICNLN